MARATKAERERRALERTAHHEAGHAVACLRLGRAFKHATIEPEEDSLGHVRFVALSRRFRPDLEMTAAFERTIDREVLIAMAGMSAERRLVGRRNWVGGTQDRDHAIEFASYIHHDDEVLGKYIEFKIAEADALMRAPIVWVQVEAVAIALLERRHLSAAKIREIGQGAVADGVRLARLEREQLEALDAEDDRISREMGLVVAAGPAGPING